MRIDKITIKNFRCLKTVGLSLDNLTILIGKNGAGKSSLLSALELFFDFDGEPERSINMNDFYNKNKPMSISVTFAKLNKSELITFASYINDNKALILMKTYIEEDGDIIEKYLGFKYVNTDFLAYRKKSAILRGIDRKTEYNFLKTKYKTLSNYTRADEVEMHFEEWELANKSSCVLEEVVFDSESLEALSNISKPIFVPAITNTSTETGEHRGSLFQQLLGLMANDIISHNQALITLQKVTNKAYSKVRTQSKPTSLLTLEENLTEDIRFFSENSRVCLNLKWDDFEIPEPSVDVTLTEDGYPGPVGCKGHGLQRSFYISLLKRLTDERYHHDNPRRKKAPYSLIMIEEPELYQHPNQQRHLFNILNELTQVSGNTQVIYSTHSPLFLNIAECEQIRLIRKHHGTPKYSEITHINLSEVTKELEIIKYGNTLNRFSSKSLKSKLINLMNPYVNEGFFANVAVLVEGESDRSCIMEVAKHIGIKFETLGISIIPVTGKANIDKPLLIFRGLGIPTYIVFDGDKNNTKKQAVIDNNKKLNRNLQTMCSLKSILDFPNTFVQSSAACFEDNLETTLRKDIGKPFDSFLKSAKKEFSCEDIKSSLVMSSIIKNAYSYGLHARTIEKIVKKIANVK